MERIASLGNVQFEDNTEYAFPSEGLPSSPFDVEFYWNTGRNIPANIYIYIHIYIRRVIPISLHSSLFLLYQSTSL